MEEKTLEERIYNPNPQIAALFDVKRMSDRELNVTELENGIVLPLRPIAEKEENFEGGVCDENFNFIAGLVNNPNKTTAQRYVWRSYTVPEEDIQYIDECVVFGGVLLNHPGHLSRDCFAQRLWWHIKNPDSKYKFVFLLIWEHGMWEGDFVKEFLDIFEIPEDRIMIIHQPTKFKKILIPDQSFYLFDDFTKEYISVMDRLKENVEAGHYEKVYFSKRKTVKQDMVNEEYFENFFREHGFEIIIPEDYSMREKISILKGAKEFASICGTNSIYSIFCEPDVKFIILERCANNPLVNPTIIEARGIHDFYSVNISHTFLCDYFQNTVHFLGVTNEWKRFVKDYFGEEIKETPEDSLREHLYDYLDLCAEYYTDGKRFELFKNTDHFEIVNSLNRVFKNRTLDPKDYKIERLQDYRKQVTSYKEQISTSREVNVRQNEILEKLLYGIIERLGSGMKIKIPGLKSLRSIVKPAFKYRVNYGDKWTGKVRDEAVAGSDGSKKPIVSFRIDPEENTPNMFYSVFTAEEGWTPDVREGKASGSIKKALPVKGLRIRFDGATSELFSVRYRVFTQPRGWTAWVEDGKATPWRGCDMIDAVQIQVVQKEDYNEKADAICNKFFSDLSKAIGNGIQELKGSETKDMAAEISALENKIAAQEYVIKSLENTLAAIVSNKKNED